MSDEIHVHVHAPKGAIVHVHVHESDDSLAAAAIEDVKSEPEKVYIPLPYPTPFVWPLPMWQPRDYRQPPPGYVGDWPLPWYTSPCTTTNDSELPLNGSTVVYWENERKP